jgi:hypothetical protein
MTLIIDAGVQNCLLGYEYKYYEEYLYELRGLFLQTTGSLEKKHSRRKARTKFFPKFFFKTSEREHYFHVISSHQVLFFMSAFYFSKNK